MSRAAFITAISLPPAAFEYFLLWCERPAIKLPDATKLEDYREDLRPVVAHLVAMTGSTLG